MNKNGYSTVRSWRDDVSESLGSLKTMSQNIEKKMDRVCTAQGRHEDRIDALEKNESTRKVVQRKMNGLIAFIVMIVTFLSNLAWRIFR